MKVIKTDNFDTAYLDFNNRLFWEDAHDLVRGEVTAHSFNDVLYIKQATCGLDMSSINYSMAKWKQLIRVYLDTEELGMMIARLTHYKKSSRAKHIIPDISMPFKKRLNASGACLVSLSLGRRKGKWVATVHSRAAEITMRWYVDLIFIYVLLKQIGEEIGFKPEEVSVFWNFAGVYQSITSMPWFVIYSGKEDWFQTEPVGESKWKLATRKRYLKSYVNNEYSAYKVQRRPQEAYQILKGLIPRKYYINTEDLELPMESVEFFNPDHMVVDEVEAITISDLCLGLNLHDMIEPSLKKIGKVKDDE